MSSAIDATVVIAWQNLGHGFHDAATRKPPCGID
jgi:hypothetical protein